MTANYARRRVGTRMTRSTGAKVQEAHDDCRDSARSKPPAASGASQPNDIPVPEDSSGPDRVHEQVALHSSSASIPQTADHVDRASDQPVPNPSHAKGMAGDLQESVSSPLPSLPSTYTPTRSTFSSSVLSKRKASNPEIDPSLRRSVRHRAEDSPFRSDSTEAQRSSTLFISQPQTPTKFKNMNVACVNRKDSLFMSLPASFDNTKTSEAQYGPSFDLPLLSAESNASSFLPVHEQLEQQLTTTPGQDPPSSACEFYSSPAFGLLQYDDQIPAFPTTPQPAFLSFPQTPRFSGSFTVAPQAIMSTPLSSAALNLHFPGQPTQMLQSAASDQVYEYGQQASQHTPCTPLSSHPVRPLPRRARASSVNSDTGSIVVKELDDNEEEAEGGNETAQPAKGDGQDSLEQQAEDIDDERFALFASQVRRKAGAMSLGSSQGSSTQDSPTKPRLSRDVTDGALPDSIDSDMFEWPNNTEGQRQAESEPKRMTQVGGTGVGATSPSNQTMRCKAQPLELPPMPRPLPPLPPHYHIENGLSSAQSSSFPLSDGVDMGVSPKKAEKAKQPHTKPREGRPPRPPNCFILYRSDKMEELRARRVIDRVKTQKDISKLVAELWKQEPQSVRDNYSKRAGLARDEHLIKYPGYIYRPNRNSKPMDDDGSPSKNVGPLSSASPETNPTSSASLARTTHRHDAKEEKVDHTSERGAKSESPIPSKRARSRTPLKQSRIPVPKTVGKVGASMTEQPGDQGHRGRSTITTSTKKQTTRSEADAQLATQRGSTQHKVASAVPTSTPMKKSRSSPSKMQSDGGLARPATPSAPRYAQATSASMSKSLSQPLPGTEPMARSTSSHPQHQYAAFAHIQHPLPLSPKQKGNASCTFEQMMHSTPSKNQQVAYPSISPPDASIIARTSAETHMANSSIRKAASVSEVQPAHRRSQTSQPAFSSGSSLSPSSIPRVRRSKTTSQQFNSHDNANLLGVPDGFVIGGKLYPAENVAEAMKAYKSGPSEASGRLPATRVASDHSTSSNGPVQELTMPAFPMYDGQYPPQVQYLAQGPAQDYVIAIAPDGSQIPLIIAHPQNIPSYATWQHVPAFMPSSAQATPSTGFIYDFSQPLDQQQNFNFNSLCTPNTANSMASNMLSSTTSWFPQQGSATQSTNFSQYIISTGSLNNGTSSPFFMSDANAQQEYILSGPSVEINDATGFAETQEPTLWAST